MRFETQFAALYAPWVLVVDPLRNRGSVAPAGSRARSRRAATSPASVQRSTCVPVSMSPPANVPLRWIQGVTLAVDDALHGLLNTLGVNVLRAAAGRGLRVLGARTVSSDTDWRFLNVRRLMSMIEKAIDVSIQWAVFEPNDWRTRAKLTLVIQSFLRELWSRGAMVGATPKEGVLRPLRRDEQPARPARRWAGCRSTSGIAADRRRSSSSSCASGVTRTASPSPTASRCSRPVEEV